MFDLKPEVKEKHEQVYYTCCKVLAGEVSGSGIVIRSQKYDGRAFTYILTNHHVVSDCIAVEKQWDATLKQKTQQEEFEPVAVQFFEYNNASRTVGSENLEADIVAYSHADKRDIALLKVRDEENTRDYVAKFYPKDQVDNLFMFDKVYAVGAGLGAPVFQTPGEITNVYVEIGAQPFIGTNSPITFGNSGGGLFKEDEGQYFLIGLPARVSLEGFGSVANHMGFAVRIHEIYEFLDENCFEHTYNDDHDPETDAERREDKRKKAKLEFLNG